MCCMMQHAQEWNLIMAVQIEQVPAGSRSAHSSRPVLVDQRWYHKRIYSVRPSGPLPSTGKRSYTHSDQQAHAHLS